MVAASAWCPTLKPGRVTLYRNRVLPQAVALVGWHEATHLLISRGGPHLTLARIFAGSALRDIALSLEDHMFRASAHFLPACAFAVLFSATAGSALHAQDHAGSQPPPPLLMAAPVGSSDEDSAQPDVTASSAPASRRLRTVRRPFLLMWKDGREEGELTETDVAPLTAAQLVIDYLNYWSAPNALALNATPDFYATKVLFHGRVMTARALTEEKRRFLQRWPHRNYVPRLGTLRTTCNAAAEVCTVRTTFDFTAVNPALGARSEGRAALELGVNVAGERPVIVFETSRVTHREGVRQVAGRASEKERD
jgi:hypothetical protein